MNNKITEKPPRDEVAVEHVVRRTTGPLYRYETTFEGKR